MGSPSLSPEEAAWVDAEVAEVADGRLGWKRFEALVEGKVAAASPELAQVKEEAAAKDRYVRMSRVNRHGIATLTIRDHAATILTAEAALTFVAKNLEDSLPGHGLNERRLAAVALMLNPEARPDVEVGPAKPKVQIYLHLTPDSPIARMEDHGPVTRARVRDLVAHVAGKVRVTPVIDLNQQISVDAYEIPARLREAVRLIHPADVFPSCAHDPSRLDPSPAQAGSAAGGIAASLLAASVPETRSAHQAATLPRDHRLARSPRGPLHRRQHRNPQDHQSRRPTRRGLTPSRAAAIAPACRRSGQGLRVRRT